MKNSKLRELRGNKSTKEIANAIGVSQAAISMYETGKRVPKDEIKKKLASYFGVTVDYLFFAQ